MSDRQVFVLNNPNKIENVAANLSVASFSSYVSHLNHMPQSAIEELFESLPSYQSQASIFTAADLSVIFQNVMEVINDNGRLGSALSNPETFEWIEQLFCSFLSDETVFQLLDHMKKWDAYSYYHSIDVFLIGALVARHLQIEDIDSFALGCLLHDVGKRLIPKVVLSKKSKLTEAEFQLVQHHAAFGANWLGLLGFSDKVVNLARHHHERLDGSGYPKAIHSESIEMEWRIIGIVDVYSALTLKRTYRNPISSKRALEIILNDHDKLCEQMVYNLSNTLQLFPPQAELVFADGQRATTVLITKNTGEDCHLVIRETGAITSFSSMDTNGLAKMVGWKSNHLDQWHQDLWNAFLTSLMEKSPLAITYFEELADGKRVEAIYQDILGKLGIQLREMLLHQKISETHRMNAIHSALQIMNQKLVEYAPSYQLSIDQGIVFFSLQEDHSLPLRLIHDLLFVNGWKTYFLKSDSDLPSVMEDRLKPLLEKPFVKFMAVAMTHVHDAWMLNRLLKMVKLQNPEIKIVLYARTEDLLEHIDLSYIFLHADNLDGFPSFLDC